MRDMIGGCMNILIYSERGFIGVVGKSQGRLCWKFFL